jgi:peptidoglycan/xylan/chitin deacetylase (PgdA/CDA1 family)
VGAPGVIATRAHQKVDAWLARGFDFLYGPAIRAVPARAGENALYLTFDDGPDPRGTPAVLDLLGEFGAKATFFLVGERARQYPELAREIRTRGHAVGNHSPDHGYATYFSDHNRIRDWIESGERMIADAIGEPTVAFRPPAGIRTPELVRAAHELATPLVLWRTRFYDSLFAPKGEQLARSLEMARAGDIVLFHDSQREENLELFLAALRVYLKKAQTRSFSFLALERSHFDVC